MVADYRSERRYVVIVSYNKSTHQIEAYRSMTDADPFWTGETIEAGPVRFELIPGGAVAIVDDCVISYSPPLGRPNPATS